MYKRKLKGFVGYKSRLELYAMAVGIRIEYTEHEDESAYVPSRSMIKLHDGLSNSEEIAIFLHELGHAMDDAFRNRVEEQSLSRAYVAVYEKRSTEGQDALVYECERRAWRFGKAIAKRCRIRTGKWYDKVRNECLACYRK